MSLLRKIANIGRDIPGTVYSTLPFQGITRPVFIIGCGRSGTTIFGTALSKHRHVTYLDEPRYLWFSSYPETDIWTSYASSRNGKLVLTAADVDHRKTKKLSRLFRFQTIKSGRPVLIEKLPINNFRLNFIHQMFPDARFIHIYRNGLEVARSIAKLNERTDWFGTDSYKWSKLIEYALNSDEFNHLPNLATSDFDKGLLEWRLSTEAAVKFLRNLPDDAFFEFNYEELIEHPIETISQVLKFVGLDDDDEVNNFVSKNLVRQSDQMGQCKISEKERTLGGKLLTLSMDGGKGLTRRCT